MGIDRTCLNVIKALYDNPLPAYTKWEKVQALPFRLGTRQGCPLTPPLFNIVLEVLATAIRQEEEIKAIQIGKKEVKLSLFADNNVLYIENPKNSTKKILELINEFNKVAGYKIKIQKTVAFLYINNELSETEVKKILFTIVSKRIKYLGINLTKNVKTCT